MTTAAPPRAGPARATEAVASLLDRSLVYVTGKGGAGKTTVAAALALTAAARGRRAIVCDLAGSDRLARACGHAPAGPAVVPIAQRVWSLSVDPQAALEQWLRRQPGGAAAVAVLTRSRAFGHFVAAAPGAKELVTIGKVVDLVDRGDEPEYDLAVADAPSTGHALGMLGAPRTVGDVACLGAVGEQARELRDFLGDPARAGYVGVALPEELPVEEVLELERDLPAAAGQGLHLIVVNEVYPDRFSEADAERLRAYAQRRPGTVVDTALAHHRRARAQAGCVVRLQEDARAPVVTLPYLFVPRLGPAEYQTLARVLSPGPA